MGRSLIALSTRTPFQSFLACEVRASAMRCRDRRRPRRHARQLHHLHHDLALGAPTVDVSQSFVGVLKGEYLVDGRTDCA